MNLVKICKTETKSLMQNKIKIVALIAVIVIPLLYSFNYLKAYWDPYGNLKNYHIAIVNNDAGAVLDGEKINYGNDAVKKLKEKTDIGFEFVDSATANDGLKTDKYFAYIQIPADFSKKIAGAKDGTAVAPTLKYVSNNKKNYIGTKISENIKNVILDDMKKTISEKYGETAFKSIYESRDGFNDAASGADKLINGTNDIIDGNKKISNGLNDLNSQVPKLQSGTKALLNGASALDNGLGQLNSQTPAISNAVGQLSNGSDALNKGLTDAKNGADKITANSKNLTDGGTGVNNAFTNQIMPGYNSLIAGLKTGLDGKSGVDALASGAKSVNDGINTFIKNSADSQKKINDAQQSIVTAGNYLQTAQEDLNKYLTNPAASNSAQYLASYHSNMKSYQDTMTTYQQTMQGISAANSNTTVTAQIKPYKLVQQQLLMVLVH